MTYRFRLTFHIRTAGFFAFDEESVEFQIGDGLKVELAARDADSLRKATRFQFDTGGFSTEEAARTAGERLRLRLRILNCMLDLGLSVPTSDARTGGVSQAVKNEALQQADGVVMDSVAGLTIYPDDGRHFEYVVAASGLTYPSDPTFLFKALEKSWRIEMNLEEHTQDALEILGHATTEASPRAQFLLMYLAVERLIQRRPRSDEARKLISEFQERVKSCGLEAKEADSLVGALAQLNEQSFPSALLAFADGITPPMTIQDVPIGKFLSSCVATRNKIAHNAVLDSSIDLGSLSAGLRQFAMRMIWTINRISELSVDVPSTTVAIPTFEVRAR